MELETSTTSTTFGSRFLVERVENDSQSGHELNTHVQLQDGFGLVGRFFLLFFFFPCSKVIRSLLCHCSMYHIYYLCTTMYYRIREFGYVGQGWLIEFR